MQCALEAHAAVPIQRAAKRASLSRGSTAELKPMGHAGTLSITCGYCVIDSGHLLDAFRVLMLVSRPTSAWHWLWMEGEKKAANVGIYSHSFFSMTQE